MRSSWLIGALVCFIMGIILTETIIGAIVGIPLILLSILLLIIGIIIPGKRPRINRVNKVREIHHYHNKE